MTDVNVAEALVSKVEDIHCRQSQIDIQLYLSESSKLSDLSDLNDLASKVLNCSS